MQPVFISLFACEFEPRSAQLPIFDLMDAASIHYQVVSRFERVHVPVDRFRARNMKVREYVGDGRVVDGKRLGVPRPDAVQFRSENNSFIRDAIVEWFDTNSIARQNELLFPRVP